MIALHEIFPYRKSLTEIVSYATDAFAAVESKTFATLPADVQCGDVIDDTGALYTSGDAAYVVVSEFVTAGSGKAVNVLVAPDRGSFVALKADNLHSNDNAAAIAALEAQGFSTSVFTS